MNRFIGKLILIFFFAQLRAPRMNECINNLDIGNFSSVEHLNFKLSDPSFSTQP